MMVLFKKCAVPLAKKKKKKIIYLQFLTLNIGPQSFSWQLVTINSNKNFHKVFQSFFY